MKVRHILGISGGKDSAALAIYLKKKYPDLKIEYYNSDTGCELQETYVLIERLKAALGHVEDLKSVKNENLSITPFEYFLKLVGGFLPSPQARWCTKKMKLEPFEKYVGEDDVVSMLEFEGMKIEMDMFLLSLIFKLYFLLGEIFGAWM